MSSKSTNLTPNARAREAAAEWVPINTLIPWPDNPRKNDGVPVSKVAESIKRFGFASPIIARLADRMIIAGHTRWKAAHKLGLAEVPVRFVDLDPANARLLALADNRLNEIAEWDVPELQRLLSEFSLAEVDMAGWSSDDLEKMAGDLIGGKDPSDVEDDEVPEPPKVPVTKFGDVWTLGRHTVVCGDSSDGAISVAASDRLANLLLTDPPYGVDYVGGTGDALEVHNDGLETLEPLIRKSMKLACDALSIGAPVYVFAPCKPQQNKTFGDVLLDLGVWRQTIVWVKDSLVLGRGDFHYQHEPCFYGWKPGGPHRPPPDRKQTTVWNFDRPKASREHPTMKPPALFAHAMGLSTDRGDFVLDPFLGSGTSVVVAEQLDRTAFGVEFSPAYCDVIVERWQAMTGGKAVRRGT